MDNPFKFFDKIFCINLDHRTDRWAKCQEKFKKLGILDKVERFSAFKLEHDNIQFKKLLGQAGCTLSHMAILKKALDNNYSNYLVLEDDFEINDSQIDFLSNLKNSLEELPSDWDILYLGGNLTDVYGKIPIEKYSKSLYQVNSCHTTHAIAFSRTGMQKMAQKIGYVDNIIQWIIKKGTIDVFLNQEILYSNNSFIINPLLILQQEDFSDIEQNVFNYKNWMLNNYNHFTQSISKDDLVTAVFTSCGRFDLLEKTINSFIKYNTYPIEKYIIIENSGKNNSEEHLRSIAKNLKNCQIIINEENIGQVSSIDKAYSFVDTEYIFHCEDDWDFFDKGFIQKSIDLLKFDKRIINVNLRIRFDGEKGSMHPISDIKKTNKENFYHEYTPRYLGVWHGFSWNPGLRRLSDYNEIKPYKQYIEESGVGNKYFSSGKISACLKNSYCKHIGTNSSTEKSNQ
jgi:GR25 family glycosyltransferase involved in LPS biosynthesis